MQERVRLASTATLFRFTLLQRRRPEIMRLSRQAFQLEFERFKEKVARAYGGVAFKSFREGLPHERESYKPRLRSMANEILGAEKWLEEEIGSGSILARVIGAIEVHKPELGLRNNLVRWQNRFGHANRSHHKLLDAADDIDERMRFERLFLDFYQGRSRDADAFEQLRELTGNRYDLLAYLFYLRDGERFMPIAPATFDQAFAMLEIDLVTVQKCSWDNYVLYNSVLSEVQGALKSLAGVDDAGLIDAHSFCWMLVQLCKEDLATDETDSPTKPKAKKDSGRAFDALERSVLEMARSVRETVRSARGAPVEKAPKPKELRMSDQQLESHIKQLLMRQENKCALTGIRLQFRGEQTDDQLLPSLDRIDSNGHYAWGNLQVVCRFINFWKGASDDADFRRLLSLVRGSDD